MSLPSIPTTFRLLIVSLTVLASGFFLLIEKLGGRVERQYAEAAEESMVDESLILAALLETHLGPAGLDPKPLQDACATLKNRPFSAQIYDLDKNAITTHFYLTDEHGRVLFDSASPDNVGQDYSRMRDVALTLRGDYGARSTREDANDSTSSTMYVGAPVRQGDRIIGVLSVSKPKEAQAVFRRETLRHIRVAGWTIFSITAACIVLVAAWFLRPIRRLTAHVLALERGERRPAFSSRSPEVKKLGHTFEKLRDALEDRAYVERYVQSLTHEMKSPVAAIRGASELLESPDMPEAQRQRFLTNIQSEAHRLQVSIDRLLALAAIESKRVLTETREIDLAGLLRTVCESMQSALTARRLNLRTLFEIEPRISGEEFLLESALSNLLQNAIDFSPVGGSIEVRLARSGEHGCSIAISDEGPGVPDYALPRTFERFFSLPRPASGRKSSGLGLCFVREAAELHHGTATLANRVGISGAIATLTLPQK